MKIQPLENYVLLRLSEGKENITELGLILPNNVEPEKGNVEAIGNKCTYAKIGDEAFFGKFSGEKFNHEEAEFLFIRESELLAVRRK